VGPGGALAQTGGPSNLPVANAWEGIELLIQPLPVKGNPQSDFNLLEPVPILVNLRNTTERERVLPVAISFREAIFNLRTQNGEIVPLTLYGQRYFRSPPGSYSVTQGRRFKPKEEQQELVLLNRLFDLSEAGDYQFFLTLRAPLYFGLRKNAPPGLLAPPKNEFAVRNFWRDEPQHEWSMKQLPRPSFGDTILIPAPKDFTVPELRSNTWAFTVKANGPSWFKRDNDYQRYD
jgi:hypothetical protein